MNKQQLAAKIWESANNMRSKIEASEYKDYILGFIFYKFLSDHELQFLYANEFTEDMIKTELTLGKIDDDTRSFILDHLGYIIPSEYLFSTWLKLGADFDVSLVRDALSYFARSVSSQYKKVFEGIFKTLETGLSKLGASTREQSKAISDLINLIKDIPMDGKQDYDVLGYIYEYLLEKFASNAGKKAGEFYTPHEVSLLMSEIIANHLHDRKEIKIYDPCSGSGSLLITIGKSVSKHMAASNNIKYYAQELKENTYNLTRMNLIMRGIIPDNIKVRNGDTLKEDWPDFEEDNPVDTYEPLYVDAVTSNPPYSQRWDPDNMENDPRYADYGVAPKSKADYAFLLHDLYHVKPDGIMTIVLPHGVLFRGGEEGAIRRNLIEKNKIDAIIGLPANIFYGTGIPTIIMVLKQKKENTDILIVDASKGYVKEGKNNKLRSCDIRRIFDALKNRETIDHFCRVVSRNEIRENDYNLNIPRYVDSSEKVESWDMYAMMFGGISNAELQSFDHAWEAFPSLKDELFTSLNGSYYALKTDNLSQTIRDNKDVWQFVHNYENLFNDFDDYLEKHLIRNLQKLNIQITNEEISNEIFRRMKDIPMLDPYEAYQYFIDNWTSISIDLEILQSEGMDAIRQIEDDLTGRVIPFDLIQSRYLNDQKKALDNKISRVNEIESEITEVSESFTEDEKSQAFYDTENEKIIDKEVNKALKDKDLEAETKQKLKKYSTLLNEKKQLNKEIKQENISLQKETKNLIETLPDSEIPVVLKDKWIHPLIKSLKKLPDNLISTLIKDLTALSHKYESTYAETEQEIKNTEKELISMLDELTGDEFDMLGIAEFKKLLGDN